MRTILMSLASAALVVGAASPAFAGGSEGSLGVGAEYQMTPVGGIPLGGVSANYDMGDFHVGGFLSFGDAGGDDDTYVALGARFFYHLHSTAMSDFSVGGSFGLGSVGDGDPDTDNPTLVVIEPGIQLRAFVVSNVALSFTAGIGIGVADAEGVLLDGQLTGGAGVHYYFF
jgi:hypothetical protein